MNQSTPPDRELRRDENTYTFKAQLGEPMSLLGCIQEMREVSYWSKNNSKTVVSPKVHPA